jgi:hypothetical protein
LHQHRQFGAQYKLVTVRAQQTINLNLAGVRGLSHLAADLLAGGEYFAPLSLQETFRFVCLCQLGPPMVSGQTA